MKKSHVSNLLRLLRLIFITDKARYHLEKVRNGNANRMFRIRNPDVTLPPDYLMYESFQLDYEKYYGKGFQAAEWLVSHLEKHMELRGKCILDWGCGPGRIVRHLPALMGEGCHFFGTDYNKASIDWCKENLAGIEFNNNTLDANLPYSAGTFNIVYGISIFTHLSEELHFDWYQELSRVLKPNGILFITTQGDNFKAKMTASELREYGAGKLVVRGKVREGHRTYSAFQPPAFMKKLFGRAEILEHIQTKAEGGNWLPQEVWMIRKE